MLKDFKQTDARWSAQKYCFTSTIGKAGCGATCIADIVYSKDATITPAKTALWMENNSCTSIGCGTFHEGIVKALKHYGFECSMSVTTTGKKNTEAEKNWKEKMRTGKYWGILLMSKPIAGVNAYHWTGSGHYVVAKSWDGAKVDILDVASASRTGKHSWNDCAGLVKRFYLIEKPEVKKSTQSNNKKTESKSKEVKYLVTARNGLNIRAGAGTGYKKVGALACGKVFTVLEYNSNKTWGRTAQGWMCLEYAKKC